MSVRRKSLSAICGGISTNIWTCSRDKTPETIFTPRSLRSRRRPLGRLAADRALQVREPPVPIGKKAVHRFASLIIASAVAISPAQAQTASELRISGTVAKLDGNLAALSLSQGISLVVRLDSEPRVNSVAKGSGSDLKAGSQVSIQAKSGQSGDLVATQIVLFAPGSNRPDAEPGPDNAQLVATIKNTDASPEGPVLTVADKDGDRKITIGPDIAIWIARAARITDIKVGSAVTMTGVKREDGSLQVLRATIGPAGAGNPPL